MLTPSDRLALARALESIARDTARAEILPRYLQSSRNYKSDGSFFTDADIATQQCLAEALPALLPGPVLGEEMSSREQIALWDEGVSGLWCVDPIDGTTNFTNGLPFFAVSIAYLVNHEPVFGVVYNPITDESFYAAEGAGAYLDGTPLPLAPIIHTLSEAVAGIDLKRLSTQLASRLVSHPPYYSQRNFGSSALEWCYVAAGRIDVYLHGGQMLWDYAAGKLILSESGGIGKTLDGQELMTHPETKRSIIAASNPALLVEWERWLKTCIP